LGLTTHTRIAVLPVGGRRVKTSLRAARVVVSLAATGARDVISALWPAGHEDADWLGVRPILSRAPSGRAEPRQRIPLYLLRQHQEDEEEPAEESYIEIVPVDPGDREGASYLLDEETTIGFMALNANADELASEEASYATDPGVAEDFAERQSLAYSGRQALLQKLEEEFPDSPDISGGDLDAAWDQARVGEETVGGSAATSDQDVVDLLGEAAGLTYEHDVPLNTAERLASRDRDRWELNPESAANDQPSEEEE
jgi:hypothetical protein